jgi:hypothetical protein
MAVIDFIDITQQGLDRMLSQWSGKPNITGLFQSYLDNIQPVEDALQQLLDERGIDTAIGVQLDVLGLIIGVERLGRNDTEYRAALKVQIAINNADGTEPNITGVLLLLTGLSDFSYQEVFPAAYTVSFGEGLEESELAALQAVLVQISGETIVPSLNAEFVFIFDDGNNLGVSQDAADRFVAITSITG